MFGRTRQRSGDFGRRSDLGLHSNFGPRTTVSAPLRSAQVQPLGKSPHPPPPPNLGSIQTNPSPGQILGLARLPGVADERPEARKQSSLKISPNNRCSRPGTSWPHSDQITSHPSSARVAPMPARFRVLSADLERVFSPHACIFVEAQSSFSPKPLHRYKPDNGTQRAAARPPGRWRAAHPAQARARPNKRRETRNKRRLTSK